MPPHGAASPSLKSHLQIKRQLPTTVRKGLSSTIRSSASTRRADILIDAAQVSAGRMDVGMVGVKEVRKSAYSAFFSALLALLAAGCAAVRETPQQAAMRERVENLVADLGHADWQRRDGATRGLREMGPGILPHIEPVLKHPDPEVAWRAEVIVRELRSHAQWIGKRSSDWHNPANWSPPYVPEEFCDVTIVFDERTKNWPVIRGAGTAVRSVFVDEHASLCLSGGAALFCSERLIVQGTIEATDGSVQVPTQRWAHAILHGPIWADKETRRRLLFPAGTVAYAVIVVREAEEDR